MSPYFTFYDVRNRGFGNAKGFRGLSLKAALSGKIFNSRHLRSGEFAISHIFSACCKLWVFFYRNAISFFAGAIGAIVTKRSNPQMIGANTFGVIAPMQNAHCSRYRSVMYSPRNAMGQIAFVTIPKTPITNRKITRHLPFPAWPKFWLMWLDSTVFIYFRPKAVNVGLGEIHSAIFIASF